MEKDKFKELLELVENNTLVTDKLTNKEKEVALNILNDLQGTLVIRATSILRFCLKAIQYSKINTKEETDLEVLVQDQSDNRMVYKNGRAYFEKHDGN